MFTTIPHAIGNTPLVEIPLCTGTKLYAKLEYCNPGGSIKDRSAAFMINHAEQSGILKPGGTIIDASSGNQGISMAMIGAAKGYRVIISTSTKISDEKRNSITAFGADVLVAPKTAFIEDPASYHSVAKKLNTETPNSFMPDQYFNPVNALAHYAWLGPEIWQQTGGKITHFFAAAGTGGTISGVGKYLKEQAPHITIIAVDSINSFRATKGNPKPYAIEGMGIDFDSPVMDYSVIDHIIEVSDEQALTAMNTIARKYGVVGGMTSGAVMAAVELYANQLPKDALAVMIFGDSGRAYLSKNVYTAARRG